MWFVLAMTFATFLTRNPVSCIRLIDIVGLATIGLSFSATLYLSSLRSSSIFTSSLPNAQSVNLSSSSDCDGSLAYSCPRHAASAFITLVLPVPGGPYRIGAQVILRSGCWYAQAIQSHRWSRSTSSCTSHRRCWTNTSAFASASGRVLLSMYVFRALIFPCLTTRLSPGRNCATSALIVLLLARNRWVGAVAPFDPTPPWA